MAIEFLDDVDDSLVAAPKTGVEFLDDTQEDLSFIPVEEIQTTEDVSVSDLSPMAKAAMDFEQSAIGKSISKQRKFLFGKTLSEEMKELSALEGKPISKQLLGIVKMSAKDTARVAPFLVGGGPTATAASKIGKLVNMFKEAARNAAITGGSSTVEELLEDKGVKKALIRGGEVGKTSGAITLAVPALGRSVSLTSKSLSKAFSRAKPWAIDEALEDPKILSGEVPKLVDVGNKIKTRLDSVAKAVKNEFETQLNNMQIPAGKVVDTKRVKSSINKLGLDKQILQSKLRSAAAREGVGLSDDLLNRFTTGKNIGFQEARKINSVLFDITSGKQTEVIGGGLLGKLSGVKSNLMKSMEKTVPEIREANRFFAQNTERIKKVSKVFRDPEKSESQIRGIAQQLAGQPKSKTGLIRELSELPGAQGFRKDLIKAVAAEEFEKVGSPSFLKVLGTSAAGLTIGGAPGLLAGTAIGVGLSKPEAIRAGSAIGRGARVAGPAIRTAAARSAQSLLRREEQ